MRTSSASAVAGTEKKASASENGAIKRAWVSMAASKRASATPRDSGTSRAIADDSQIWADARRFLNPSIGGGMRGQTPARSEPRTPGKNALFPQPVTIAPVQKADIRPRAEPHSRELAMKTLIRFSAAGLVGLAAVIGMAGQANAAQCGNSAAGFESWKQQFAPEAKAQGVGAAGIAALMQTSYAQATINADRGQRSFRLSLPEFLAKRGATAIVARGRSLKQSQAALFANIEQRHGVPPGPLIAIWGMETAFGTQHGNQNAISSIATLAYDCRRPEYFTDQLYAALKLVDRGVLSAGTRGSMHGEIGQTQFLPKNILNYGT